MEVITIESKAFQELLGKIESTKENKPKEPKDIWLDNQEIMQQLKISKRTIQHYRDTGLIAFSQVGNKIYYRQSDIDAMLNKHYNVAITTQQREFGDQSRKIYCESDLIEFGKYLFSKERDNCFENTTGLPDADFENTKKAVHHADYENFKVWHKKRNDERQSIIDKANGR